MYYKSFNSSVRKAGTVIGDFTLGPRILVCNTSLQTLHCLHYMWFSMRLLVVVKND